MVNYGINYATIIGILELFLSVVYFFISLLQVIKIVKSRTSSPANKILQILQIIVVPIIVFISGFILLFNGWRLSRLFAFQQFIVFVLLNYLIWENWQFNRYID